ncbi:MAG: hypothetical protein M1834_008563 [Cirrosporium novae-zelandiae]|nr:MAG: hypothetical protein M1834_008563 [Cirrosporium novae-zelandiae]
MFSALFTAFLLLDATSRAHFPMWRMSISAGSSTCNGYAELCDRKYSNVTFVGAHDSAFVGYLLTQNQHWAVSKQLSKGYRYLQGQTHKNDDDVISMCHTTCSELDSGTLATYLTTVKDFLDDNANEVVTLLLTNSDAIDISEYATIFEDVGLDSYAFTPSTSPKTLSMSSWPTLQTLIDDGTRLIVFMGSYLRRHNSPPTLELCSALTSQTDYNADESEVSYILDEFNYYFETSYDVTDSSFPDCSIDRPSGASATGRMYIVNHFLDIDILGIYIPYELVAGTTNSVASIEAQATICEGLYNRNPNVVLLDYVDMGKGLVAEADMNGVS